MKPYYQDEFVTLFHGDCLEVTDWLDADVLVTDPPYGIAYQSGMRKQQKLDLVANDETTETRDKALELWGESKPALVFGHWKQSAPVGEIQRLIWHKASTAGMGNLNMPWGTAHEDIHVLGLGWDRVQAGVKRSGSVLVTRGVRGGSYGEENLTGHPTPKPIGLIEQLIEATPPGLIADPFAGGGSTLIAARNLGRKVIGVELEEKYCEIIARRLAQQAFNFEELGNE